MRKIVFDTINGIQEVSEFEDLNSLWYYGYIHNYGQICAILNRHQETTIGAMSLSEESYNRIAEEYGIKEI